MEASNANMFRSLQIRNWRQFDRIDVEFHPRLTVLTGENGTGKTTLLNLLNRHFGWSMAFQSLPWRDRRGAFRYLIHQRREIRAKVQEAGGEQQIGTLRYDNDQESAILIPREVDDSYFTQFPNQQAVDGLFVPSHRPVFFYERLDLIPASVSPAQTLLDAYVDESRSRFQPGSRLRSPSARLKEALVSLAMFGEGNSTIVPNPEAREMYQGFVRRLRLTLPPSLGFQRLRIQPPDVLLETRSGPFALDAVSGGIAAIIDLTWQTFLASQVYGRFVVLIDEPENHLHPELQRTLLPGLLKAFPTAAFVAVTHNPFIISSVPDSNVYVFRYTRARRIVSSPLDDLNKAGTSNDILRDALGLNFTMPLWVESRMNSIVDEHVGTRVTADTLRALKVRMNELGLGEYYPAAVDRLLSDDDDQA